MAAPRRTGSRLSRRQPARRHARAHPEAIEEAAGRGNVVIVAHAASFALAGKEGILRVLVTASPDTRAGRAEGSIKDSDAERADYLRRFYGVEQELPTHYDLVVNTDVVSVERAADHRARCRLERAFSSLRFGAKRSGKLQSTWRGWA